MPNRSLSREDEGDELRIGRRGFIGAGLAGAGAALVAPGAAAAAAPARARAAAPAAAGSSTAGIGAAQKISPLPIQAKFPALPGVPVDVAQVLDTVARLKIRSQQVIQPEQGLTNKYTIGGVTRTAYEFLFGATGASATADALGALGSALQQHPQAVLSALSGLRTLPMAGAPSPKGLSLDLPGQFSIGWTNFPAVYQSGLASLPTWSSSLSDADTATAQFWPTIAEHGNGYNLIIPEKVKRSGVPALRRAFKSIWNHELDAAVAAGRLYVIDMSRFESLQPQTVGGATRFTPATVTLLTQNPRTKDLTPVAVLVSGYRGRGSQVFARSKATDGAWIYALQAARASITVFGVWLGHVYHWHIVTAAMQMTMFNTFPTSHPMYQLIAPQSKFTIGFDDVLLLLWSRLAPPTSLSNPVQFLQLTNDYATGRRYFDDDPEVTLSQLGLRQKDFTVSTPWDRYPVVQRLLAVWSAVSEYASACVRATYRNDASVARDRYLQTWIAASAARNQGNIRGLPRMTSRAALERVVTSLLYRETVHGVSSMNTTANPALTFVANFPHCLQRSDIPRPTARINTRTLLTYLPNTATIGEAIGFYSTFVFSPPYESLIPLGGVNSSLFFPGGPRAPRNQALVRFRTAMAEFIDSYDPAMPQRFQWPLSVEL
jgi:hypothetical protein